MSECFTKLDLTVNVSAVADYLVSCNLWGEHPQRGLGNSPHREMVDIWARYNDPEPCYQTGDWSSFADPHESIWLKEIPGVREICAQIMEFLGGSALGGVLLTKLPPGGEIYPHTDSGWHAAYYDKYYVPIINEKGSKFIFPDGEFEANPGEVWAFRNDVTHAIENNSETQRISMIVCCKQSRLTKWGSELCRGDMPPPQLER